MAVESMLTSDSMDLPARYASVRTRTISLCEPLSHEDMLVQSMPDASPTKWHLAHTSWFFETFILSKYLSSYKLYHADFSFMYNSYYNSIGDRVARDRRGLMSRPTLDEVLEFRRHVDSAMDQLLATDPPAELHELVELGLQHEQQHQELILTDILHALAQNPLQPVYRLCSSGLALPSRQDWVEFVAGIYVIGHDGNGFSFDNESPRHRVFLESFSVADRLVTQGEYLGFMEDGGYQRPEFWLSEGWATLKAQGWTAPIYWDQTADGWGTFSLSGFAPLDFHAPVSHVSYYEAEAFARWAGARLPTEFEWEVASAGKAVEGNFVESGRLYASGPTNGDGIRQMFGDLWEWTGSAYLPYPGYRPAPGAIGEYNGKFMCNQFVLRGGSCASPQSHLRATYRNFFPPNARWQFTGIRLARSGRVGESGIGEE